MSAPHTRFLELEPYCRTLQNVLRGEVIIQDLTGISCTGQFYRPDMLPQRFNKSIGGLFCQICVP